MYNVGIATSCPSFRQKMQILQGIPNYECIDWTQVFHNWGIVINFLTKKPQCER